MKKQKIKRKIKEKKLNKILLTLSNVTKKFRLSETQIISLFENFNLVVREGEFVGFYGPNGSGKSTLLNIISGIDEVDSGGITYNEMDINKLTESERDKLRASDFGFLTSNNSIIAGLSVEQNIELPLLAAGIGSVDIKEKLDRVAEDFLIKEFMKKTPESLSLVQLKQIQVAKAFSHSPKVMFIDEFAAELKPSEKSAIYETIFEYSRGRNIALLIASDDISICSKATKLIRLESGKIS